MNAVGRLPLPGTDEYLALVTRQATTGETRAQVEAILADVRKRGDAAVCDLTERFDYVRLLTSSIPHRDLQGALDALDPHLRDALGDAASHLKAVHHAQRFREERVEVISGVTVWREWRPLRRVGLYVPGGRTIYPSSVLMLAIPALVAGCPEVVLCTPPRPDGRVAPVLLAAAALAGVSEVHAIGGVQAIAAMAYGTETVARVDKIFGPGNPFVTAAKLLVYGEVAIDMPAGPSELLVIADGSVPPAWIAADLRAQAEHSPDALGLFVTPDGHHAAEIQRLLGADQNGQVRGFHARDLQEAIAFSNDFAPEHLSLACVEPGRWLPSITRAGSVFLGPYSPTAAGDYATGSNAVIPTGGTARAFSALGLEAFGRTLQVQAVTAEGLGRLERVVEAIADAEHLPAHRDSVRIRLGTDVLQP